MSFLDDTLNWANYADSKDKVAFFKEFIQFFGNEEMNAVRGIISRKRRRDFKPESDDFPQEAKRLWKGPRLFTGCRKPIVSDPVPVISPVEDLEETAEPAQKPWWENFPKKDYIAFDIEAVQRFLVTLIDGNMPKESDAAFVQVPLREAEKARPKAAYLSVVNKNFDSILEKKIQHPPGTFRVDHFSKTIAGISSSNQLQDGQPFHTVIDEFTKLCKNKYAIVCGASCDYGYLELLPKHFLHFDLQSFYQRPSINNPLKMEPMSLQDIFFFHFNYDFQRGPHSSLSDAKATIKIFMEGYVKLDHSDYYDFSEVPNLKSYARNKLYWCRMEEKFTKMCDCVICNNIEF